MVILLSDLHLSDEQCPRSLDPDRLLGVLGRFVEDAKDQAESVDLVLLGDIFEMLHSPLWLETELRPWDPTSTAKHAELVERIFLSIHKANELFFEGIARLKHNHEGFLRIHYIIGNHDRSLATRMGFKARRQLLEVLPLEQHPNKRFRQSFPKPTHGLVATHGHEWDPANRDYQGCAAIGDAIVIEILLQLPRLLKLNLGLSDADAKKELAFLEEIGFVSPRKSRPDWILRGLSDLRLRHPSSDGAIRDSFAQLLARFDRLEQVKFGHSDLTWWWKKFLASLGKKSVERGGKWGLKTIVKQYGASDKAGLPPSVAAEMFGDVPEAAGRRFLVSGHTHEPEISPIRIEQGHECTYLNTGNWGRVHRQIRPRVGARGAEFTCWEEECLVIIRSPEEWQKGFPPYEFWRNKRGLRG